MSPTEPSQKSYRKTSHVYVRMGLEGQDDDVELLQGYFREMQTMTVETSMDAELDLLTFALSAHYFGVIMLQEVTVCLDGSDDLPPDEDGPEELSRDLDDAELAELNIPRPITVEEFLALPEKERLNRWKAAWEAKRKGSLYDDTEFSEDRRGKKKILRPGDIDYYMSDEDDAGDSPVDKGKMRERDVLMPCANPQPIDYPISKSVNNLINWPEDIQSDEGGPPSSDDDFHSISTDNMSESPPFPYVRFGFPVEPLVDPNFGREYFEPDTEPPLQLPPIPEDPIAKEVVRQAALRKVDELRGQTVHLYEKKKARLARRRILEERSKASGQVPAETTTTMTTTTSQMGGPSMGIPAKAKPIGLVYLTSSQIFSDALHKGECNMGFYVAPEHRRLSCLSAALHKAVEDAFRDPDCHRLQAVLVDHPDILDFLNLYAAAGFRQEGIRRRAFFSQIACEWKDVTYLAILATEWIHDHSQMGGAKVLPSNLWEEIISRHQREQEEFIRMEEMKSGTWPGRVKRSSSLETIREAVPSGLSQESEAESSGFTTDASSSSSSSKRRKFGLNSSYVRVAGAGSYQCTSESEWDMADDRT